MTATTSVHFHTVDVFTDRVFGGNPLAVILDAEGLSSTQMQAIAREFNLSETTFVLPPERPTHTCRVRIFTPTAELPFAGHPTLGTAVVLTATGKVPMVEPEIDLILDEGVGPVPVTIRTDATGPMSAELSVARLPEVSPPPATPGVLAEVLSLEAVDVADDPAPAVVSCGTPFLFVRLVSLDAVRRAKVRRDLWDRTFAGRPEVGVFLFTDETETPEGNLHGRMFAPTLGADEDPATGSAVAALAGFLGQRDAPVTGTHRWVVEQGFEMGRPSRLDLSVDTEGGAIIAVRVAGSVVPVSHGEMLVPETV